MSCIMGSASASWPTAEKEQPRYHLEVQYWAAAFEFLLGWIFILVQMCINKTDSGADDSPRIHLTAWRVFLDLQTSDHRITVSSGWKHCNIKSKKSIWSSFMLPRCRIYFQLRSDVVVMSLIKCLLWFWVLCIFCFPQFSARRIPSRLKICRFIC